MTPYGVKGYYPLSDSSCLRPTIHLDGFAEDFILAWLELHSRSEHVIDGRRYDAELQFVHMGANASDVAIVSVLIDSTARADNDDFQWMINQWQEEVTLQTNRCNSLKTKTGTSLLRKRALNRADPPDTRSLAPPIRRIAQTCKPDRYGQGCEPLQPRLRMFPYSLWPTIWYYAYHGSLTAPPCSNIVRWRILDEPMLISRRQFKQMASLLTSYTTSSCVANQTLTSPHGENFRPLQPLQTFSTQPVAHCRYGDFSYEVYPVGQT